MNVIIPKSEKPNKKLKAVIDKGNNKTKTVHFGAEGYSDYTIHKDDKRKERYLKRHKKNEDWSLNGIEKPAFYATNVLWNKKTVKSSIDDLNKKFKNINFKFK